MFLLSSYRYYVSLQKIYQAKAESDCLVMEQRVRNILKRIGRDPDAITKAYIKNFCRNARKITVSILVSFKTKFCWVIYYFSTEIFLSTLATMCCSTDRTVGRLFPCICLPPNMAIFLQQFMPTASFSLYYCKSYMQTVKLILWMLSCLITNFETTILENNHVTVVLFL